MKQSSKLIAWAVSSLLLGASCGALIVVSLAPKAPVVVVPGPRPLPSPERAAPVVLSDDASQRCPARTERGGQCRNYAYRDTGLCYVHWRQSLLAVPPLIPVMTGRVAGSQ